MQRVVVVGVGGCSSSGKTTVAERLALLFPNSFVLHQDDFYKPDSEIPFDKERGEYDWDCPDAIDFEKFKQSIELLKAGKSLPSDFKSIEEGELQANYKEEDEMFTGLGLFLFQSTIKLNIITQLKLDSDSNLDDLKFIFIDGFMLYHDQEIINLLDVSIFLHAYYKELKSRRENRKGYTTVEGYWVDPPGYFDKMVWPGYATTHKHLFINENINGNVNKKILEELGIRTFRSVEGHLRDTLFRIAQYIVGRL